MEIPRSERCPAPRGLLAVAGVSAVIAALCIVVIDQPLARLVARYEPLAFWDPAIDAIEYALLLWIHRLALPIVLVLGMIVTVSVRRLRIHAPAWKFIAGTHLATRLTTGWFKDGTARLRPGDWLKHASDETFGWEGGVAFPSGHVTLFASVLIPLAVLVPRTRPLFAIIGFVMVARVAVNAHFVSDTVAAITLVALWTWIVGSLVRPIRP